MGKKLLSILLAALMIAGILSMTALADGSGLTVTKANGDPAVENTDYYYSGKALWIIKNGLAVSGTASSAYIRVDEGITNLTLDGVDITGSYLNDVFEIIDSEAFELILKGDNVLTVNTSNYGILSDEGPITISGTLSVTADSYAISTKGGLYVSSDACTILARGGYAAINNNMYGGSCIKTLAEGLVVTASTSKDALVADITGTAVYSGDSTTVGGDSAKAVLITKPASAAHTHGEGEGAVTFEKEIKTVSDLQDLFTNGGSGYLAEDITLTETGDLSIAKTVDLCLNDKVLNLNSKGNISVNGGYKFNLYDCGTTKRKWDVDATGLWVPAAPESTTSNTTVGGVITGGSAENGGGVHALGPFTMNGGNIVGNTATNGGGIWMDSYDKVVMLGGSVTGNTATDQGGGLYYGGSACIAKGTMITLADGTRKPVEELDTGDDIRVFDHETGTLSHAKISDYWHYGKPKSGAFTLHFSNKINVTAVTAHSFYEKEENRYVSLNAENAKDYIGHSFYHADAGIWETLESVTLLNESVETYLVATEKHLDCITEGMLSCEDDIYTVFRNVFAFGEDMKVDEDQKATDIAAAGGLWRYEDCPLFTKASFDALNLQYAKVAVDKGVISFKDLEQTALYCSILDTGHFESSKPKTTLSSAPRLMLATAPETVPTLENFSGSALTFGKNAQIKDNFRMKDNKKTANNIYLTSERVITLATGTYAPESGMLLYVSIEADSDRVPITGTAGTDDVAYFKSDDPTYVPAYDTENSLINLEKLPVTHNVTAQVQGSHGQAKAEIDSTAVTEAKKDESVVFTATADSGYAFDYWEVVSGGITLSDTETDDDYKSNNPITLTMPDTALTLKAHFKAVVPTSFNIIVEDDGHGTAKAQVESADVDAPVAKDTAVTLVATANDGYRFKEWQIIRGLESGDISAENKFTMPANEVKVKAVFERVYNINLQSDGHADPLAWLNDADSVTMAKAGDSITLHYENLDEGYEFEAFEVVSGTIVFDEIGNTFTMPAENVTIRMTFKKSETPGPEGECVYDETVKLAEGAFGMKLNGKDMGEFLFEKIPGGWSIQNKDGKYLAMQDGKLVYSDTAFAWTYKNGAFSASVKTTQKTSGHWFLFFYIPGSTKTVTTTYYLSTVTDGAKLSTCYTCAELYTEVSGEHDFGCWIDCKDGENHKHICKHCGEWEIEAHDYNETTHKCICGAFDPSCATVDVTATYATKTTKQFSGFLFWGTWKNITTYTATVKAEAIGVKVTKIEVSANQNKGWTKSNTFTSDAEIERFYVRLTTSDGEKRLFMMKNGIAYPAN